MDFPSMHSLSRLIGLSAALLLLGASAQANPPGGFGDRPWPPSGGGHPPHFGPPDGGHAPPLWGDPPRPPHWGNGPPGWGGGYPPPPGGGWGGGYPPPGGGGGGGNFPPPGGGPGHGFGGCFGCSYTGDYYGSNFMAPRPAPPKRFQGEWRNGWWYY